MNRLTVEKLLADLPIEYMSCLDPFAGEALRESHHLAGFKSLVCWEIRGDLEAGLRMRLPHADIHIGDSFTFAKDPVYHDQFDVVACDNHVGEFGGHIEHFDFLQLVPALLKTHGYLIVNICTDPIFYHLWHFIRGAKALSENITSYSNRIKNGSFKKWLHGRSEFYGSWELTRPEIECLYRAYFKSLGVDVVGFKWVERRPWLYFMRVELRKR